MLEAEADADKPAPILGPPPEPSRIIRPGADIVVPQMRVERR
jgi:hypothetical protein